ncbi:MAG: hypothetical protein REJ23_02645 [Brevundimonas sp.]|nr:hypothetical protein [Brevundimonas sp.]
MTQPNSPDPVPQEDDAVPADPRTNPDPARKGSDVDELIEENTSVNGTDPAVD